MQGFLPVLSALLGIIVGIVIDFVFRLITDKKERAASEAERVQQSQRISALAAELAAARTDAAQSRELAERRAGWESLAVERERMIGVLNADREKIVENLAAERDRALTELRQKSESERRALSEVSQLRADLLNERKNLGEKIALLDNAKSTLTDQFQALATEIVDKRSKAFADENKKDLDSLLSPLREQLTEFRRKVEEAQSDSRVNADTLQSLIGGLNSMNQQLAQETRTLSTALRGPANSHSEWGELIVRNLLEKAGLREGEHFRVQEAAAAESNGHRRRLRPDVILNLPGGRHLLIDSRISLTAWADCVNAAAEAERKLAMKRHLAALRAHIDALSARGLPQRDATHAPGFHILFVPIEPAFLAALHEDDALWRDAWDKQVLLVGPTTLLFVIRIVDHLWQQEFQTRHVKEVMDRGAALHDRLVEFVSEFETIGAHLRKLDQSYNGAMSKLHQGSGSLVRQAEALRQLGVKNGPSQQLLDTSTLDDPTLDDPGLDDPLVLSATPANEMALPS